MSSIFDVCSTLSIGGSPSLNVDFIGKGNLWLDYSYCPEELRLAQSIIHQALAGTAPGQLSIWGYDRDLSGVFAPFAALSSGESKLLELISDDQDLQARLNYLKQQIQSAQNVIQGRADSLLEFREAIHSPVEGYSLVVLFMDMDETDRQLRSQISRLARVGPSAGVSFFIISSTLLSFRTSSGENISLSPEQIVPHSAVIRLDGGRVSAAGGPAAPWRPLPPQDIIDFCGSFAAEKRQAKMPVVPFQAMHQDIPMWSRDSVDGLTFSIGKFGTADMEITIGDEVNQRHNAIITGAVGQGKSNLISVIIHSLCWRYSPKELRLYLIDFKEGVTFKPFSNIDQEEYLPHAEALGLESDAAFCIAVLESLHREYQRRMRLLKDHNVKSIRELRLSHPDIVLPRIVAVIDEFQMMFGDGLQSGQRAAELLEKSVRLFRAAGIHFILASQTLGGNLALAQRKESIFGQVPIRIALKNSIAESQQTLSVNNPAAAFLRPREAVVNLDYGEPSQNRKTMVAFADEAVLAPARTVWWEKARAWSRPPYVFESARRITPSASMEALRQLRRQKGVPAAALGVRISVEGSPVLLPQSADPGYNIAIIGTPDLDCNQAAGMMQAIAVSLAVQHPEGDARFLFCDFAGKGVPYEEQYPDFAAVMESAGYFIESVPPEEFAAALGQLSAQEESGDTVYLFGAAMDRWRFEPDPYGQGSPLKSFVESAPSKKMHFIGWWVKAASFTAQVAGFGTSDAFNSKVFLRIDERTVQSLTNPFVKWSALPNRALISDAVTFTEEADFIPYAPVSQEDLRLFEKQIWD